MVRINRLLLVLTCLAVTVSGCGSSEDSSQKTSDDETQTVVNAGAASEPPGVSVEQGGRREVEDGDADVSWRAASAVDDSEHAGKAAYARCAACHLQSGEGVPGAFPPLHENVLALAKTSAGREYLSMVVKTGLVGAVTVNGRQYLGAMPAQHPALDDSKIADVLNYIITDLNNEENDNINPFTPAEISSAWSKHAEVTSSNVIELRKMALEERRP